ncbi:MAG: hypothetical protein EZS28_008066 [Streblomastix strix]|uniref:Glycerophosphocholine acyltransferase 1 n=1 Tax=Streblomastix strix TaxID=222440 RepID=A0A5J4WNK1_9EUKA|nr:MAG: hypothetical protein EZS28_008066 [Streblomastix strix]
MLIGKEYFLLQDKLEHSFPKLRTVVQMISKIFGITLHNPPSSNTSSYYPSIQSDQQFNNEVDVIPPPHILPMRSFLTHILLYLVWELAYTIKVVFIDAAYLEKHQNYSFSERWITQRFKKETFLYDLYYAFAGQRKIQGIIFAIGQFVYSMGSSLPALFLYNHPWLHGSYLALFYLFSTWNGATYYLSRKPPKEKVSNDGSTQIQQHAQQQGQEEGINENLIENNYNNKENQGLLNDKEKQYGQLNVDLIEYDYFGYEYDYIDLNEDEKLRLDQKPGFKFVGKKKKKKKKKGSLNELQMKPLQKIYGNQKTNQEKEQSPNEDEASSSDSADHSTVFPVSIFSSYKQTQDVLSSADESVFSPSIDQIHRLRKLLFTTI